MIFNLLFFSNLGYHEFGYHLFRVKAEEYEKAADMETK